MEGVDIRGSTQQTLIEDNGKHQPGAGKEQVAHSEEEKHRIDHLWTGETNGTLTGISGGKCSVMYDTDSNESKFFNTSC